MLEVRLDMYKNPGNTLASTECCVDADKVSVCRTECSNTIWLCVSRKISAQSSCDLADVRMNKNNYLDDDEKFGDWDSGFDRPFIVELPADFNEVSRVLVFHK